MGVRYIYGTIAEELPELAQQLVNQSEGYRYHIGSAAKLDWICPNCGSIVRSKSVNKVVSRGIPCVVCSDGTSKPEKIVASALTQSGIRFESQKLFEWSGKRRYDFYLPDHNIIIEVNGSQHYGFGFKNISGVSLEKQIAIDNEKRERAIKNGIINYIIIEAMQTSAAHIVPQLECSLKKCNVHTTIDISICESDSMQSDVIKAANLWKQGMQTGDISHALGKSASAVIRYLKTAAAAGICDYSPIYAQRFSQSRAVEHLKRQVHCVNTGKTFASLSDACREYNISSASNIIRSCNNPNKHAGVHDGTPLSWEYI